MIKIQKLFRTLLPVTVVFRDVDEQLEIPPVCCLTKQIGQLSPTTSVDSLLALVFRKWVKSLLMV